MLLECLVGLALVEDDEDLDGPCVVLAQNRGDRLAPICDTKKVFTFASSGCPGSLSDLLKNG